MGDVALHEEARLQARLVLVAHHNEGGDLEPSQLRFKFKDGFPLHLHPAHREGRALRRVLAQVGQELRPAARVLLGEAAAGRERGEMVGGRARALLEEEPGRALRVLEEGLAPHRAAAARADDEARRHGRMRDAEVQRDVAAHGEPAHVRPRDAEVAQEGRQVLHEEIVGVGRRVRRDG